MSTSPCHHKRSILANPGSHPESVFISPDNFHNLSIGAGTIAQNFLDLGPKAFVLSGGAKFRILCLEHKGVSCFLASSSSFSHPFFTSLLIMSADFLISQNLGVKSVRIKKSATVLILWGALLTVFSPVFSGFFNTFSRTFSSFGKNSS